MLSMGFAQDFEDQISNQPFILSRWWWTHPTTSPGERCGRELSVDMLHASRGEELAFVDALMTLMQC